MTARQQIEQDGILIIPSILDSHECDDIIKGTWDFFEHITQQWSVPIDRDDTKTWREIYKLAPQHSMLFQHWGVGQAQVSWNVRQNPKIVNIFADIWRCKPEDLLVSMDGLSFHLPPEITNKGYFRKTWYHCDQSFIDSSFQCVQGWVTALDVDEGDATLAYLKNSHKYHAEFSENFGIKDKSNWHKLTPEEEQFYLDKGCEYEKVVCPKGSLVLWDSRLIHCGTESKRNRDDIKLRCVIYVCYTPKHWASTRDIKNKNKALQDLRTTNHYPHRPKLFPKMPRLWGATLETMTPIDAPHLSELGKSLSGS